MICEMEGKWPYRFCSCRILLQDLFKTVSSILVQFPSIFFYMRFFSVQEVHSYSSPDTATAWKKSRFIFIREIRFPYHRNPLSIVVYIFPMGIFISILADEILLPRFVNSSTNFRGLPLRMVLAPSSLEHTKSYLLSRRSQCLLVLASGNAIGIRLGKVYL